MRRSASGQTRSRARGLSNESWPASKHDGGLRPSHDGCGFAVVAIIVMRRPVAPVPSPPPPMAAGRVEPVMSPAAGPAVRRMPPPAANSRTVRLAVFPAPRPLSPQEKLLLAYIRNGRLEETATRLPQPLDEDLKIPKLDVTALDVKPIENSEKSPEK